MKPITILRLAFFAMLTGCSASASTDEQNTVVLDGKIEAAMVERVSQEIVKHPKGTAVLVARSTGGQSDLAMQLGDVMLKHGVSMVVRQYCSSACSQYLIPSATSVRIEGNASITLHGSPARNVIPERAHQKVKDFYANYRITEKAFFEARGIDYRAYLWVQQKRLPICWFENPKAAPDDASRYGVVSRINFVAPSKRAFEQLGFKNLEGNLPKSAKQAWEFATHAGYRQSISMAFADEVKVPENWEAPKLTECSDRIREMVGF